MTFRVLCVSVVCLVAAATASAHDTEWAWTEPKAGTMVKKAATIRLPPQARASLEAELRKAVAEYLALEQTAAEEGYELQASLLHNLRYRFSTALKQVQRGLEIEVAACTGMGRPVGANRFKRFRRTATSQELEIPSAQVIWEDDTITAVIEGKLRIEGPFHARLAVRPGRSTIAFRQIG